MQSSTDSCELSDVYFEEESRRERCSCNNCCSSTWLTESNDWCIKKCKRENIF